MKRSNVDELVLSIEEVKCSKSLHPEEKVVWMA